MKPFHNCSELRCLCLCAFHSGQLQASKIAFLSAFICCETGAFILMHIQKRAADMTWIILNPAWKGGAGLEVAAAAVQRLKRLKYPTYSICHSDV